MNRLRVRTTFGPFPSDVDIPEGMGTHIERRGRPDEREEFKCPPCLGTGWVSPGGSDIPCRKCDGTGNIVGVRFATFVEEAVWEDQQLVARTAVEAVKKWAARDVRQHLFLRDERSVEEVTIWTDPWGVRLGLEDPRPEEDRAHPPMWAEGLDLVARRAIGVDLQDEGGAVTYLAVAQERSRREDVKKILPIRMETLFIVEEENLKVTPQGLETLQLLHEGLGRRESALRAAQVVDLLVAEARSRFKAGKSAQLRLRQT